MDNGNQPVIVSAVRTAVGRAFKGTLRETRPDDLAAACFNAALERAGGFDPGALDDIVLGCAMPEGPQGLNLARLAQLRAGMRVVVVAGAVDEQRVVVDKAAKPWMYLILTPLSVLSAMSPRVSSTCRRVLSSLLQSSFALPVLIPR